MEIIIIWLYIITYGILKELSNISHLFYITLVLLSTQSILQFIFCYDYWKAMPTMFTAITQECSMSVPEAPWESLTLTWHSELPESTFGCVWFCYKKMLKSMQPSHSFGCSSEDLWIMCFYSRAGTIYLLKNIRKETQAFFQSITLRGMEDLQQNCWWPI